MSDAARIIAARNRATRDAALRLAFDRMFDAGDLEWAEDGALNVR